MNAAFGQDINLSIEQFLEILSERDEVDQGPVRIHLDQQVYVAIGAILTPGGRAEQADVVSTVPGCDPKDILPLLSEIHRQLRTNSTAGRASRNAAVPV